MFVFATEKTTVTQQVNHRPIKYQVRRSTDHIMVKPATQTNRDPNRDKILARSNQPRTSESCRRQDHVFGHELQFLLSCLQCCQYFKIGNGKIRNALLSGAVGTRNGGLGTRQGDYRVMLETDQSTLCMKLPLDAFSTTTATTAAGHGRCY